MWQPRSSTCPGRGYSLIELLVVLGIIALIGLTAVPNIFNRNDRLLLDSAANQIRQVVIKARTDSLAPGKAETPGAAQVYQVAFGSFATDAVNNTVTGGVQTNRVSLQRGQAQCDSGDLLGGFTSIRELTLPRGIYISRFYPTNQRATDSQSEAVIRFSVGQVGFVCGELSDPVFRSTSLYDANWSGKSGTQATTARYMLIELSSQRVAEHRYVLVDRLSGEVSVARSNPQSYFNPVVDVLPPRWNDVDQNNFLLSVSCGASESDVTITFPRAKDRVTEENVVDPNLFVVYDISWNPAALVAPLAFNYFHPLTEDTVRYSFTTDLISIANQPSSITIQVVAKDSSGLRQPDDDPPAGPAGQLEDQPRLKTFTTTDVSCGTRSSDKNDEDPPKEAAQTDPEGSSQACNPVLWNTPLSPIKRLSGLLIPKALAIISTDLCEGTVTSPDL